VIDSAGSYVILTTGVAYGGFHLGQEASAASGTPVTRA